MKSRYVHSWDLLIPIDQEIKKALPPGMSDDGTKLTIDYQAGFEMFGSYETWDSGYRVTGQGVTTKNSSLDVAVKEWIRKYKLQKEKI